MSTSLLIVFMIADLITTVIGANAGLREMNPLADSVGIEAFIAIKVMGTAAITVLTWRMKGKLPDRGVKTLCVLLAAVALSNALGGFNGV